MDEKVNVKWTFILFISEDTATSLTDSYFLMVNLGENRKVNSSTFDLLSFPFLINNFTVNIVSMNFNTNINLSLILIIKPTY